MRSVIVLSTAVILVGFTTLADTSVIETRSFKDPKLGLTVVAGKIVLPVSKTWSVVEPDKDSSLGNIQLALAPEEQKNLRGDRVQKAEIQTQIEQERHPLWTLYWACSEYAKTNNGVGPNTWEDIRTNTTRHLAQDVTSLATNFFLLPAVPIQSQIASLRPGLLALQLRPITADGKHWVLYADGHSERVPIDALTTG